MDTRIERAWEVVLGPMVMKYTRNVYVRGHVLYVSLSSSVLRNELTLCRERLIKSLNEHVGATIIRDIIIR